MQCHNATKWAALPWWIPKAPSLKYNRCSKTKKYGPNERTRTQSNDLEQKEEINIQVGQNGEKNLKKNEERLKNFWDNFKCSTIWIIRLPEGEEEEQESEYLFEKNNEENFPNLAKETDFQEVKEAQRVPKKLDTRRNTPRHIIIKLSRIKDKEMILNATREKETVTYKGVPIRLLADFSKETL